MRRYRGAVTRLPILAVVAFGLAIAGCGSSSSTSPKAATPTTVSGLHPPGATPSASSQMICSAEAKKAIAASLGMTATVSKPTWIHDVYACNYAYKNGVIALSVKELANAAQTTQEFNAFGAKLGRRPDAISFGQGAFITTNGSVIVRKDYKVLYIDVSKIPQNFGSPPQDRSNVALSIAATVMSCWTGA
jgi:hypothetical protein